ncbi:DUF202 domain-containing protein [Ornithinimicrobium sp. Arc0846-15]|nr:DUF202 domain-containing protein [Ornithinimicrobium laminariae]
MPLAKSVTAVGVDPGLQPERTTMAWSRTAMALVIVSVLLVRWWPIYGTKVLLLPAIALLGASLIMLTQSGRMHVGVKAIEAEHLVVSPWPKITLLALTVFLGLAGVVLVLLGP